MALSPAALATVRMSRNLAGSGAMLARRLANEGMRCARSRPRSPPGVSVRRAHALGLQVVTRSGRMITAPDHRLLDLGADGTMALDGLRCCADSWPSGASGDTGGQNGTAVYSPR